ncbi:hypothetical protein [Bradyrhizobium sp.]
MKFPWLKFTVLVGIWYELSMALGINGGAALYIALLVVFIGWLATSLPGQVFRMLGPRTQSLVVHGLIWLFIFWWMTPPAIFELPLALHGFVLYALALAGARARRVYERERSRLREKLYAEHSGLIVAGLFGGLLLVMMALRTWHSVLPLLLCALLPGIPFHYGWRMGAPDSPERADAKLGDAEDFRNAGLSEER